ncbi:COP9 signalosome subunit 6 isoform X2 [Arctopsyche grandis]|uniref:COP9 signalosome subunit 6 isoform X2 n=1 Tax=Arctopsyche grandis TaxID=121162 RepID=UPI00406DA308
MMSSLPMEVEVSVSVESASAGPTDSASTSANSSSMVTAGAAGTAGSVSVSLHPLVIMNISEHWTRLRAQEGSPQTVIGAIIGKQKGRNIEVMNSFELVFCVIGGDVLIDRDYYTMKEEQFKQVFSDMDFLGWYTTGESPTEKDIAIHRQICEINESPILLQLNPNGKSGDQLPVCLYESVVELVGGGETALLLSPLKYTLAAEEAERVGVDHVARVSSSDAGESSLVAEHLTAQRSAIRMVAMRVRLVARAVAALRSGELPPNAALLREARALAHRLPLVDNPSFTHHFYNQCNDVGLMTYLGSITKGCNDINQFVNKFNILYDKQTMGRRMRGLFF